jgi:hypothetical protein
MSKYDGSRASGHWLQSQFQQLLTWAVCLINWSMCFRLVLGGWRNVAWCFYLLTCWFWCTCMHTIVCVCAAGYHAYKHHVNYIHLPSVLHRRVFLLFCNLDLCLPASFLAALIVFFVFLFNKALGLHWTSFTPLPCCFTNKRHIVKNLDNVQHTVTEGVWGLAFCGMENEVRYVTLERCGLPRRSLERHEGSYYSPSKFHEGKKDISLWLDFPLL